MEVQSSDDIDRRATINSMINNFNVRIIIFVSLNVLTRPIIMCGKLRGNRVNIDPFEFYKGFVLKCLRLYYMLFCPEHERYII